jgi:hypothetical protein
MLGAPVSFTEMSAKAIVVLFQRPAVAADDGRIVEALWPILGDLYPTLIRRSKGQSAVN